MKVFEIVSTDIGWKVIAPEGTPYYISVKVKDGSYHFMNAEKHNRRITAGVQTYYIAFLLLVLRMAETLQE